MTADGDGAGDGAEAATNWVAQSSELIQNALNLVTDGKFIGLLTIMFGIGLPIDWYLRLSDHGFAGTTRYITSAMVAFGVLALVAEFYVRRARRADAGDAGDIASDMIAGQWYTYWTLLIYLGIAALLIAFSALWLRRFPRGPVELVWHWSYEAICAALDRRKEKKAAKAAAKNAAAGKTNSAAAATGSASPSAT